MRHSNCSNGITDYSNSFSKSSRIESTTICVWTPSTTLTHSTNVSARPGWVELNRVESSRIELDCWFASFPFCPSFYIHDQNCRPLKLQHWWLVVHKWHFWCCCCCCYYWYWVRVDVTVVLIVVVVMMMVMMLSLQPSRLNRWMLADESAPVSELVPNHWAWLSRLLSECDSKNTCLSLGSARSLL